MLKYGNLSLQIQNTYNNLHTKFKDMDLDRDLTLTYRQPTKEEVMELYQETERYSKQERIATATHYDKISIHFIKEYSKRFNVTDKILDMIDDLKDIVNYYILKYKIKFNAARPFQLADHYDIPLYPVNLITTSTPSYPSGHAGLYYAFYLLFKRLDPDGDYRTIMMNGWNSRVISGIHFEQDNIAAKIIVDAIATY